MNIKSPFFFIIFSIFQIAYSQEKFEISGQILSDKNEAIPGANITIGDSGTTSDFEGYFRIKISKGEYTFKVSYLGFKTYTHNIRIDQNKNFKIQLSETEEVLEEVLITQDVEALNTKSAQMSVNTLKAESIKKIPAVFGEVDVIRSLLQLPGVSNGGEGTSGFNVRGGNSDQNLILVDDVVLFNASHLFGFFSVFNANSIDYLKLYKAGIPANFGGRVSSVLDIKQKKGSQKDFKGSASIGVISSQLLLEGPIKKDKSSFLFAGRGTYAHLFLKLTDNKNSAYFYDLNGKYSTELNPNNKLNFSVYHGNDYVTINDSFSNTYGSTFANLNWNHRFNPDISADINFSYSLYGYLLDLDLVGFEFKNDISNLNLNAKFNHRISNDFKLNYGVSSIKYNINPGNIKPTRADSGINLNKIADKNAYEHAVFLSAEHQLSENLKAEYGIRLNAFWRMGEKEFKRYTNDNPILYDAEKGIYEKANPSEVVDISKSHIQKEFYNLEPRASLAYSFNDNTSIKASFNRLTQNLHLLSNTSSPTPFDVWTPSGTYVKPQKLNQYSFGYFKNFENRKYSLESEVFFKTVKNRIDYVDGANLIANDAIEQVILNGESRAYGLEFLLRKNKGQLTGWIAYTLSKSEQKTPGRTPAESGINNGEWYLSNYDKTHDISVVASYEMNKKWTFNSSFNLQTGRPVSFPVGQFEYQDLNIPVYEGRNLNRLPAYHRLDISATLTPEKDFSKNWTSSWTFGIYNLYNRKNAASLNFEQNETTGLNEANRFSIFGIVPSVSYQINF
ncbi:MAG: TonB-dependent receptor [Psychroflexus halocasei]